LIQEFLLELRKLAGLSPEEFLSDSRNPASVETYLRRSLEAIFDTGRYILAKAYGFKDLEYKAIALQLGEKGLVDREYSRTLIKMAGYRNRMVHLYHEVSREEIYEIIKRDLPDIERFVNEASGFIEDYKKSI